MTEERKGIQDTIELVDLACDAVLAFEAAEKDGKLDASDIMPTLTKLWPDAVPAFSGIENIPAELGDLNADEVAQLVGHVAERLTFDNARATAIVEKSLKVLAASYQVFVAGKELRDAINLPSA